MNNLDSQEAKLNSSFVNDINVSYEIKPKSVPMAIGIKSITITGLVNNVFDKEYVSNGYIWDVYPYYYPQAGMHFLLGLNLKF